MTSPPPDVNLCRDCRFRRPAFQRGPADRTPCAMHPGMDLPTARDLCEGRQWQAGDPYRLKRN